MTYLLPNKKIIVRDWGLIDYKQAWDQQEALFAEVVDVKLHNRQAEKQEKCPNYLVFCEHPPVYTLGKSGSMDNLLLSENQLHDRGFSFYKINRGGDITHHGPGQLVMYPIFDLENFFTDIHKYLRLLEEAVILCLQDLGISSGRFPGYTGVWIDAEGEHPRKICAMGVKCSRWVSMHGIALNVRNDLGLFDHIVPCGIKDKEVTSIKKELGQAVEMEQVKALLLKHMLDVFEGHII